MKTLLIPFLSLIFSWCCFAQNNTQINGTDSIVLTYHFISNVQSDTGNQENIYTREVEIHRANIREKIWKYDFFCTNIEIKGPNNVSYIRKVAYIFDEISVLVDVNGKIIDVSKPADMDQRWEKTKEKILLEYKGEIITNYLKKIDQTIEDKEQLKAFLQSDAMYGLLLKAYAAKDNLVKSSKLKVKEKGGIQVITPTSIFKKETEEYTFKGDILDYAVKTVPNIKYEIKYAEQLKP